MKIPGWIFAICAAMSPIASSGATDDLDTAKQLDQQGIGFARSGHYQQAEVVFQRSLEIREKALGAESPEVASSLDNLGNLYKSEGRYQRAEVFLQRSLTIVEQTRGPQDNDVAEVSIDLAILYDNEGRLKLAEPLYKRAIAIWGTTLGPDDLNLASAEGNLGRHYKYAGRYAEAEALYWQAMGIYQRVQGPTHYNVATGYNNIAQLYVAEGKYAEAEPLFQKSLSLRENALGPDHPSVAESLNNISLLLVLQGRYAEAEAPNERALAIWEKAFGPDSPDVAASLNNLAELYRDEGKLALAEPLYQRAIAIQEKISGRVNVELATTLNNLAYLYYVQGNYAFAEPLFDRSKALREEALGEAHPDVLRSLNNLAALYKAEGRYAEAEQLLQRAVTIGETALGPNHPDVAFRLSSLAAVYHAEGRFADEDALRLRALNIYELRAEKKIGGKDIGKEARTIAYLPQLALLANQPSVDVDAPSEALKAVQLARQSETATAFADLAERLAVGSNGMLAKKLRDRQDLGKRLDAAQRNLLITYSLQPDRRAVGQVEEQRNEAEALAKDYADATAELAAKFPAFSEFEDAKIAELPSLQAVLQPREAMLAWILGQDESYLLVVRKQGAPHLIALPVGEKSIATDVDALRSALVLDDKDSLAPFPASRAHTLFINLFSSQWEQELVGIDHLFLVPEGALTRLPFSVLMTDAPLTEVFPADSREFGKASWLLKRFATSVLPSLSSLIGLRALETVESPRLPFMGIGAPHLTDEPETSAEMRRGINLEVREASAALLQTQGVNDRAAAIRQFPSLPNTADELLAIAKLLGADPSRSLMLRDRATVTAVKQTDLAQYEVIAFATHGVLAGELGKGAEPGLILSPPKHPSETDYGYLTMTDIADLRLNARWVILSACNTAGGTGDDAEGLSGLAKAFTYAGAKALFVSHWAVETNATSTLTGLMLRGMREDHFTLAQAHRYAMIAMLKGAPGSSAHPSLWSPFVIVGDGGILRRPLTAHMAHAVRQSTTGTSGAEIVVQN